MAMRIEQTGPNADLATGQFHHHPQLCEVSMLKLCMQEFYAGMLINAIACVFFTACCTAAVRMRLQNDVIAEWVGTTMARKSRRAECKHSREGRHSQGLCSMCTRDFAALMFWAFRPLTYRCFEAM